MPLSAKKRRLGGLLDRILAGITILSFLAMALTVLLQIVTRSMPKVSFVWTEELSRFLFVLAIASAAPLAFKSGDFVYIEFLIDHPRSRVRPLMQSIVKIITFLLFAVIAFRGIDFIRLGLDQKSSAMALPMAIPYSFLVFSAFFILWGIAADALKALKALRPLKSPGKNTK